MKVSKRSHVIIPKKIREQFGIRPNTEVEFHVTGGEIVLKKAAQKLDLSKWKGRCRNSFAKMGYSVGEFIENVRGR